MEQLAYDKTDAESILSHARKLLGKSLHDLYPMATMPSSGKGGLGQAVEVYHFGYDVNSISEADFYDAGVELKCTPLKTLQDGSMVSKERLVLNIINYIEEYDKNFETSSFTRKNALLLLMFYLHISGVDKLDLIFKIIRLWHIPEEDLKIFIDDWNVIHRKIVNGLAHELSEGDTLYLAACTKGSKSGAEKKPQKIGNVLADQRAYSIKSAYINHIIVDSLSHQNMCSGLSMSLKQQKSIEKKKKELGNIVRSVSEYKSGETFEELVIRRFTPYFGMAVKEIADKCEVNISPKDKAVSYTICRAILKVKSQKIAEFEKAGIQLKTIRLEESGRLKEAMSFPNVKYTAIVNEEEWEDSDWYRIIAGCRFFFVVFRKKDGGNALDAILENVFFWALPSVDFPAAESLWRDTRDKVRIGDYEHFLGATVHSVCHIRPKAQNAADMADTPQGGKAKKYCWWLNRDYVLDVVRRHMAR